MTAIVERGVERAAALMRRPAFGIALAGVLVVGVVGGVALRGGSSPNSLQAISSSSSAASAQSTPPAERLVSPGASHRAAAQSLASTSASGSASGSAASSAGGSSGSAKATPGAAGSTYSAQGSANATTSSAPPTVAPSSPQTVTPSPVSNGRKTIQSAQLQLMTTGNHIDVVSQELFNVVGLQGGVVKSSTITQTGGQDGYASFQLSIPSANLAATMTELSQLRYANVASRTDQTQDVNNQYDADVRALADAKALRTSLLKQLAGTVTQTQIDSLQAQIKDSEAAIAADEQTLASLNNKVNYSSLQVQINAGTIVPVPVTSSGSSAFTLHRAWHDAVRVLTVTAGVALIALAVLLPVALIVALGLWIASAVRRHRRETALDAA